MFKKASANQKTPGSVGRWGRESHPFIFHKSKYSFKLVIEDTDEAALEREEEDVEEERTKRGKIAELEHRRKKNV